MRPRKPKALCRVCADIPYARGLCRRHYHRLRALELGSHPARNCDACGRDFSPYTKNQIFCGLICLQTDINPLGMLGIRGTDVDPVGYYERAFAQGRLLFAEPAWSTSHDKGSEIGFAAYLDVWAETHHDAVDEAGVWAYRQISIKRLAEVHPSSKGMLARRIYFMEQRLKTEVGRAADRWTKIVFKR